MKIETNRYKLYQGDCLEVMKNIPDKSINLVLIDPPYNIGKDKWDKWDTIEDYVEFMGKVFLEIQRVLKYNGSFYFFHNDFLQMVELQNFINKYTEFEFKQLLIWNKRFNETSKKGFLDGYVQVKELKNYQKMAEYCLYYTFNDKIWRKYSKEIQDFIGLNINQINKILEHRKSEHFFYHSSKQWNLCDEDTYNELIDKFRINTYPKFIEYKDLGYVFNNQKQHHSVMNYEIPKKQTHITPKNTDMLEYLIKTSSNEEDVILDCFMGSGSTGVACLNSNRRFIGIELDEDYFNIATDRLNKLMERR